MTQPPLDAAAVALFVPTDPPRVMWARRAGDVPFLGGYHSFPGGHLDDADHAAPNDGGTEAPLRVAALRELFEETGVLLLEGAELAADERERLRLLVRENAVEAHRRIAALGGRWATKRLEPIGRWVTPSYAPMRFDTRFYAARVDAPPEVAVDDREIDRAEFVDARAGLEAWGRGEALLAPPVVAVLRVMADRGWDPAAMRAYPGADGGETLRYEVVPNVQLMPLRTPTLPPATHTNAYLVGSGEAVLVEPASPYPEELERAVRWIEENRRAGVVPGAILATHHHPDHVGGAVALSERLGLPLWAHEATAGRLEGMVAFDRHLADGEVVELDGPAPTRLRAVHTPGHAPGHLCFVEERSGAMIAGDMVASIGTILVEPGDGDMGLYLDSLRRMAALEPSLLLPAHGGPIRDPQQKLAQYVQHRLWREEKVHAALAARAEPAEAASLVPEAYDDAPRVVWPLAERSVEAHLLKLEKDGRVRRTGSGWRAA